MKMRWLDALVIFYGIVLIVAGIDGFIHHSIISLIAGGISGLAEIGFAAVAKTNPRVGRIGSAVVALLILGKFLPDYLKKHAHIALALSLISVIVFVCLLGGHFYAMSQRKSGLVG